MSSRPMSDHSFAQFLLEEKLMGARCMGCELQYVPPRALCPQCHGSELAWIEMRGTGTLAAFTFIAIGTAALQAEGYGRDNPYCTGVVILDEGPRVVARIEGLDPQHSDQMKIGAPLKVRFLQRGTAAEPCAVLAFGLAGE